MFLVNSDIRFHYEYLVKSSPVSLFLWSPTQIRWVMITVDICLENLLPYSCTTSVSLCIVLEGINSNCY